MPRWRIASLVSAGLWLAASASVAGGNPDVLWTVGSGATVVAVSPDDSLVATANYPGTIKIYSRDGLHLLSTFWAHYDYIYSLAFSSDGTMLASGSNDSTVKLWRTSDWSLIRSMTHVGGVYPIAFSPDGSIVASGGFDGTVKLWNVASGTLLRTLTAPYVNDIKFTPDGQKLVAGNGDSTVLVYRVSDGTLIRTMTFGGDGVDHIAVSPDGQYVAVSDRIPFLRVYRLSNGTRVVALPLPGAACLAYSPDGQLLLTGQASSGIVWRIADWKQLVAFPGEMDSGVFAVNGQEVVSAEGRRVCRWRVSDGTLIAATQGQTSPVDAMVATPDGSKLLSGSWDGTVIVWDAQTGAVLHTLVAANAFVWALAVSPNGKSVAVGTVDTPIQLFGVDDGSLTATLAGHSNGVQALAYSPDGSVLASGGNDRNVKLWDIGTNSLIRTLSYHSGSLYALSYSPDGGTVVSAGQGGKIEQWRASDGYLIRRIDAHTSDIHSLAFAPNGAWFISASDDGTVKAWDVSTGSNLWTMPVRAAWVGFSPNGLYFVCSGSQLGFYRTSDRQLLASLGTGYGAASSLALAPDGSWIGRGTDDSNVTVFRSPVAKLTGHVELEDYLGGPGIGGTLEFRAPGTTNVLYSAPITLDAAGGYAAPVPVGTYDIGLKPLNWLRQVLPGLDVQATGGTADFWLYNGDADGNNAVDIPDLSIVLAHFHTVGPDGDLDHSGTVNLLDLSAGLANFDRSGDP